MEFSIAVNRASIDPIACDKFIKPCTMSNMTGSFEASMYLNASLNISRALDDVITLCPLCYGETPKILTPLEASPDLLDRGLCRCQKHGLLDVNSLTAKKIEGR
jgi:hypothetical protein